MILFEYLKDFENLFTVIISCIASVIVAYITAKITYKREIKKLLLKLDYKDKKDAQSTYSELLSKIDDFCNFSCDSTQADLTKSIAYYIKLSDDNSKQILADLDLAVSTHNIEKIRLLRKELFQNEIHSPKNQPQKLLHRKR